MHKGSSASSILHRETKKGSAGRGRKKSQIATSNEPAPAFIDDTAQKIGKNRSTVARAVKRGKDIPNVAELAGTSLDQGAELDALAKLKDIAPERQAELIEKAKAGEKVSAKAEIKKARRDDPPDDITEPNNAALVPEPASEPVSQQRAASVGGAPAEQDLAPAPETDAAPPTALEPALDPHALDRAIVRDAIRASLKLKGVDFGSLYAAMPIEELQKESDEVDEVMDILFAWSAALEAAIARAMSAEEEMTPAA